MNYKEIVSFGKSLKTVICKTKFPKTLKSLLNSNITTIITFKGLDRNVSVVRGSITLDEEYNTYVVESRCGSMATFKIDDVLEIDDNTKTIKLMYNPMIKMQV